MYVIMTEFCERLAFYSISGNLLFFMQKRFRESNERADVICAAWVGMCYVTPLVGGLLADRYMRRVSVILVFSFVYLLGLLLLLVGAAPVSFDSTAATSAHRTLFYVGITAVALGAGGIKPNASTLGASQFPPDVNPSSFFNWFYFAVNLGALLANTVGSYVFTFGVDVLGGASWSFCVGWSIPAAALAVGLVTFWSGRHLYQQEPRKDAQQALRNDCQRLAGLLLMRGQRQYHTAPMDVSGRSTVSDGSGSSGDGLIHGSSDNSPGRSRIAKGGARSTSAASADEDETVAGADEDDGKDAESALPPRGLVGDGSAVEEEEADRRTYPTVLTVLPFLALMVPYWGVYVQMNTTFQNQGCQMNRVVRVGNSSLEIPVSMLQAFDTVAVLALVPVFDRCVYPLCARLGRPLTLLQRVVAGFLVAGLAMAVAAAVEVQRKAKAPPMMYFPEYEAARSSGAAVAALSPCQSVYDYDPTRYQQWLVAASAGTGAGQNKPTACSHVAASGSCVNYASLRPPRGAMMFNGTAPGSTSTTCFIVTCDPLPLASSLSSLYQIPQYALIGASEVLASVAALEFFFSQTAPARRGLMQSLNLLTTAVGSFAIIPLVLLVNAQKGAEWLPSNLDFGYLERYFAVLAAIMAASTGAAAYAAARYRYVGGGPGQRHAGAKGRARAESSAPLVSAPASPSRSPRSLRRRRVAGESPDGGASADDVEAWSVATVEAEAATVGGEGTAGAATAATGKGGLEAAIVACEEGGGIPAVPDDGPATIKNPISA